MKMATPEQKAASLRVMHAVTALNEVLTDAGVAGLFIDLTDTRPKDSCVPRYIVERIETRETVLP
jgi:hypothetical protein